MFNFRTLHLAAAITSTVTIARSAELSPDDPSIVVWLKGTFEPATGIWADSNGNDCGQINHLARGISNVTGQ